MQAATARPGDEPLFDAALIRPPYGYWPRAPHDPRDHEAVRCLGPWSLRVSGQDRAWGRDLGPRYAQLWQPFKGLSVLTPSSRTAHRVEVFPVGGRRLRLKDLASARALLRAEFRVALPDDQSLRPMLRALGVAG